MQTPEIPPAIVLSSETAQRLHTAFNTLVTSGSEELHLDFIGLPAVPAALVRWLLLQALPEFNPRATRIAFWHATIDEKIALADTDLKVTPAFARCQLNVIDLTDARVRGLEVIGGSMAGVHADRMVASGTLLLRGQRDDPTYHHALPADVERDIRITSGILMSGASIHGNLDLRGAIVGQLPGAVSPVAILADGLTVDGNVLAGGSFAATGEIRLDGCTIGRDLNFAGASLANPGGYTLSAIGAEVRGTVYLCRTLTGQPLRSEGTLRMLRTRIAGDLDASGSTFVLHDWDGVAQGADIEALHADEIKVGGSLRLVEGFEAFGQVRLVSAQIGGDLLCTGARFEFPGENAFIADGATISGTADFSRASCSGLLRFELATLKQGFVAEGMVFDLDGAYLGCTQYDPAYGNACGLHAAGASFGGGFSWRGVTRRSAGVAVPPGQRQPGGRTMWLAAQRAKIDAIDDDEMSWEHLDRIDVRDARYESVRDLGASPGWRLARLDREYAPWNVGVPERLLSRRRWRLESRVLWHTWREQYCLVYFSGDCAGAGAETLAAQAQRFAPSPYLQFARTMRNAGFSKGSDEVLLGLERNRTRYGGHGVPALVGRWVLDIALRYGQRPFRPLWFMLVWVLASGALFKWLHDAGKQHQLATQIVAVPSKPPHHFQWLHFALDSLLPFVSLGQKANFVIEPPDSWFGWLLVANAVLGYVLLAFFAAGLTGLVRGGRDGS